VLSLLVIALSIQDEFADHDRAFLRNFRFTPTGGVTSYTDSYFSKVASAVENGYISEREGQQNLDAATSF
jgi:hypothetical protein